MNDRIRHPERVTNVTVTIRVDTNQRRLEYDLQAPDGSLPLEIAFLIRQALTDIGGAGWTCSWAPDPIEPVTDKEP